MKKVLSIVLSLQLIVPFTWANDLTSGFSRAEDVKGTQGNIFVSGQQKGSVLMKVNLWGAVKKSGIHYIPPGTDFVSLLSYAGGPLSAADLEDAYIKRKTKDSEKIIPVNIRDLVSSNSSHNPKIEPNDIIVVPQNEPTVSQNTVVTVGFVSTLLSLVLASVVLSKEL